MTKDEAFNRCWSKYYKEHSWNYMDEELSFDLAYYFWKSALEQPTNMVTIPLDKLEDMQRRLKEQPTQEPVATIISCGELYDDKGYWLSEEDYASLNNLPTGTKLYTHPPKEWQGLSDDEIEEVLSGTDPNFIHGSCIQGILWAEAKLKEKNT